jgi:hypothetical protein
LTPTGQPSCPSNDHEFMEIFIASADRRALTLEIPAEAQCHL